MTHFAKLGRVAALAGAVALTSAAAQAEDYLLATASTGGTYYPVGVALATLTKIQIQPRHGMGMTAINSAGSGENVRLLREDEVQFAILQGLYGYYAVNGVGPLEAAGPQTDLRSVTMLWQNVEQFVIDSDRVETGTVADLATLAEGEKAGFGKRNSGTIGSNTVLLRNLGVDIQSLDLLSAGYGPTADALQNGEIAAVGIPSGPPTGALTKLFASAGDSVTFLTMTPEQQAQVDGGMGLWTPYVIAAGVYPGQDEDWATVAQPNFLAARADVSDDDVYLLTKTVYENLAFLNAIHPATKAMALEKAISGLPAPLHPGAARYYTEMGIDIPAHLVPAE